MLNKGGIIFASNARTCNIKELACKCIFCFIYLEYILMKLTLHFTDKMFTFLHVYPVHFSYHTWILCM